MCIYVKVQGIEKSLFKFSAVATKTLKTLKCLPRFSEAVVRRCSVKKVSLRPATLLKKRLWHRCFPVNFAKFLRTPFFI